MGCAILCILCLCSKQHPSVCYSEHIHTYIHIYIYIYFESQPGSWLVAICERSENRGSGGGG